MAYDGWVTFNGIELVNLSRTAQLAEALGVDTVWIEPASVDWIQTALGGVGYDDVTEAPWYDPGYPASGEFAGIIPLALQGLDDSTMSATTVEYITDGGRSGTARNATLSIVANVALVGTTDRGVEYGLRWLNHVLRGGNPLTFCSGVDLTYFRTSDADSPVVHRRDVRTTRGVSVTRKRTTDCSSTWMATFTMTADDPYEYGESESLITNMGGVIPLGGLAATGPAVLSYGFTTLTQESCPVYDYSPVYDPLYPALVAPPTAPDFYPEGWPVVDGDPFKRVWARVASPEPSMLNEVPIITLTNADDARGVRVSIWPAGTDITTQCNPLFSVVVSYLPADLSFVIDGEQKACYVWDGVSPLVRRSDSLAFNPSAQPVEWVSFNDPTQFLVTLDTFPAANVRMALDMVPKSD